MAGQVQKSELFAKYGSKLDNAVKQHANDEIKLGFQRVPPGIKDGIARVTECGFAQVAQGKQNAGEWYFRAVASVLSPKAVLVDGEICKCEGSQTSIIEMVCETKNGQGTVKTVENHISAIMQYLKKLGAETSTATTIKDLEGIAAAIKTEAPYIKFSTSLGKGGGINPATKQPYEPKVFENWNGLAEPVNVEAGSGMIDSTGGGDKTNGSDNSPNFDETADHSQSTVDEVNWDSLVEYWDGLEDGHEKERVTEKLTAMAIATGATAKAVGDAPDWAEVKELMDASEVQADTFGVVKGVVYKLEVDKDSKDSKKGKKKIEVETISVDIKLKTCTLKDCDTKKTIMDNKTKKPKVFAWNLLIEEE